MAIGDRIRRARLSAGLSQRALAAALGVTHGIVGQWESHRKSPGRENLRKIAEITLTSPDALLHDVEMDAVLVRDPQLIAILRLINPLTPRAKDNLLNFLKMRADIGREIEETRHPAHRPPPASKVG